MPYFQTDLGQYLWKADKESPEKPPTSYFHAEISDAEHQDMMDETTARLIRESEAAGFTVSPTGVRTRRQA